MENLKLKSFLYVLSLGLAAGFENFFASCDNGKEKLIRFGEQGAETAGKPKEGESDRMKQKRASFKARHAANIAKGKMSAAYWANREKW